MPTSSEIFKKYPNKIFIETGSYHEDGFQKDDVLVAHI